MAAALGKWAKGKVEARQRQAAGGKPALQNVTPQGKTPGGGEKFAARDREGKERTVVVPAREEDPRPNYDRQKQMAAEARMVASGAMSGRDSGGRMLPPRYAVAAAKEKAAAAKESFDSATRLSNIAMEAGEHARDAEMDAEDGNGSEREAEKAAHTAGLAHEEARAALEAHVSKHGDNPGGNLGARDMLGRHERAAKQYAPAVKKWAEGKSKGGGGTDDIKRDEQGRFASK